MRDPMDRGVTFERLKESLENLAASYRGSLFTRFIISLYVCVCVSVYLEKFRLDFWRSKGIGQSPEYNSFLS